MEICTQRLSQLQRPPLRSEASQPCARLLTPGHSCWEAASTEHLAVKISEDSIHPGEKEVLWEPRIPLNAPTQTSTHRHSPWAPAEEPWLRQHQTYTERLSVWLQGERRRHSHHCVCATLVPHMPKSKSALACFPPLAPP